MPKDMVLLKILLKKVKTSPLLARSPHVSFIIKVVVLTSRLMKQKGFCISMFVWRVGLRKVSHSLIHKLNVVRVQNMSKPGHDPGFESCP